MIHILGWYNYDNIGDEAYKIAFPKLLKTEDLTFGEKIEGNPEMIILGGGDVMNAAFLKNLDNFPNTKKLALSVNLRKENVGPHLDKFDKIIARNFIDFNHPRIQCCPDFTFILEGNKANGQQLVKDIFKKHGSDLYENLVIITMNSFLCKKETMLARDYITFEKVAYDLAKLMDNTSASFLFVPFGNGFPGNDRIPNAFIYANSKFWKKNVLLFDKLTVQQTLDLFTVADAAISTRLHSGIFSCIGGIPFVDIAHHSKTKLFMEFIGKKDWELNFWNFDYFKCFNLIKSFLDKKDFYKNQVCEIRSSARSVLNKVISQSKILI